MWRRKGCFNMTRTKDGKENKSQGLKAEALIVLTNVCFFCCWENRRLLLQNMLRTSLGFCCCKQEKLSSKRVNCESEFARRSRWEQKELKGNWHPLHPPPALKRRAKIFKRSVAKHEYGFVCNRHCCAISDVPENTNQDFWISSGHEMLKTQTKIALIEVDKEHIFFKQLRLQYNTS